MPEVRKGRQTPTKSIVLPYTETHGQEAIDAYNEAWGEKRQAQEWQELMMYDILAVDENGLWVHTKFGWEIPRRNGKNEIVTIRELWGLEHGERILHTAHRTTASTSASRRLAALLDAAGYVEVTRIKKNQKYDKHYTYTKQLGMERIVLLGEGGGTIDFRTRSSKGGLGEGFDLLVIDEAQEYQDDQESALKYVVTDSRNPQTLFCGTPPTPVSSGTVFLKLRNAALQGETVNTGWAEWSVDEMTDPMDREAWYETNPSLGTVFTERSIQDEVGTDEVDFNIQRLGLWLRYNQKSAISKREWEELDCRTLPALTGKLFVGIKYGHDGDSVAMSIAVRTADGRIFVEAIDCRPMRAGDAWILDFLAKAAVEKVVVDGANGQELLSQAMKKRKIKAPMDNEVDLVAENQKRRHGGVTVTPVKMVPYEIEYGARVSENFMTASEEEQLDILEAFIEGFSKKTARGLDIMSFHGVNPRDGSESALITMHFDKIDQTVAFNADLPDECVEDAVALIGDWDATGIAMSKTFASAMGKMRTSDGAKLYPGLSWGGDPKEVNGVKSSVNSTVSFGDSVDRAIVGDFANCVKWGYAKEVKFELIPYGDPDNTGVDLKGSGQVYLRATTSIGFGILVEEAFARIVEEA